MKKYWIYLVGLLLVGACEKENGNSNEALVDGFTSPVELKGTSVFENEYSLAQIVSLDSLFLISTRRDTIFHIYNRKGKKISSFGRKGRGPNELTRTFAIEDIVRNSPLEAFIYDEIRKELVKINMTASINSGNLNVEKRIEIPDQLQGAFDFLFVNEQEFIGVYDDHFNKQLDEQRGGFYFYPSTGEFQTFSLDNLEIEPYENMPATNINARVPAISPDRSKMAIAMMHYPQITIFNVKDSTRKSHLTNSNPPDDKFKLENFKDGDVTEFYSSIYTTNNYIYLLYSGYKVKESPHPKKIQVLDWHGNPQAQYLIPAEYNVSSFIVDEKNQQFYTLSYPKDTIFKFDYSAVNE